MVLCNFTLILYSCSPTTKGLFKSLPKSQTCELWDSYESGPRSGLCRFADRDAEFDSFLNTFDSWQVIFFTRSLLKLKKHVLGQHYSGITPLKSKWMLLTMYSIETLTHENSNIFKT